MSGMTTRPDRGGEQPSRPPAVETSVPPIPEQPGAERTPDLPEAARPTTADVPPAVGEPAVDDGPAPRPDRAQYGVCAFLALVGGLVILDATTRIGHAVNSADPIGPRPVPILLGVLLLIVAAIYGVDVARGGTGEPEAGEDVDLSSPIDWRTVLLLIGAFLVNAVLIDRLGWVISGTILFWGSAYALGNRHYVRNLLIAVALSLITFYTFAIGLGVNLPAGVLQGIL
jgi:putative tricarboxylic transport membrane protein